MFRQSDKLKNLDVHVLNTGIYLTIYITSTVMFYQTRVYQMQPQTSIRNSSRTNETETETGICASLKFEFISTQVHATRNKFEL